MNIDTITQAFSAQMYTAVVDVVQQVDPLTGIDAHADRTARVIKDVAGWLAGITPDELAGMEDNREYLDWDRWMAPADDYDAVAVCDLVQVRIFAGLDLAREHHFDAYQLIHGTAAYLIDMDKHKAGWLAERAANLLAIGL